jgi:glyoxylate reductase
MQTALPVARVFVTRNLPFPALDRLKAAHDVDVWPGELPPPPDELRVRSETAEGLLCMLTDRIDDELMQAAPHLRAISNYAVGADNIDLDAAERRGIAVGVTPDVLTDATADLAMALILAAARRLPEAQRSVKDGHWRTWEPAGFLGIELRGARLLVLGAGRIGRAVADRARAFGMEVDLAGRDADVPALLATADAVSIHTPLTEETKHLIDAGALARMKPTAVLVNTARGGIVDTDALVHALRTRQIGGAALDVTDPEPLPQWHPLLELENALVVPHIGSATHAARARMAEMAVDNLLAALHQRR